MLMCFCFVSTKSMHVCGDFEDGFDSDDDDDDDHNNDGAGDRRTGFSHPYVVHMFACGRHNGV